MVFAGAFSFCVDPDLPSDGIPCWFFGKKWLVFSLQMARRSLFSVVIYSQPKGKEMKDMKTLIALFKEGFEEYCKYYMPTKI